MCDLCWESYFAGYIPKSEVWQCIYYLDLMRSKWEAQRRIPKRDPDDPLFKLEYGEGLFASILSEDDYRDWYYLQYLPTYRRRCYRENTSGEGADAPEERAARGDVLSLQGTAKITNY